MAASVLVRHSERILSASMSHCLALSMTAQIMIVGLHWKLCQTDNSLEGTMTDIAAMELLI